MLKKKSLLLILSMLLMSKMHKELKLKLILLKKLEKNLKLSMLRKRKQLPPLPLPPLKLFKRKLKFTLKRLLVPQSLRPLMLRLSTALLPHKLPSSILPRKSHNIKKLLPFQPKQSNMEMSLKLLLHTRLNKSLYSQITKQRLPLLLIPRKWPNQLLRQCNKK